MTNQSQNSTNQQNNSRNTILLVLVAILAIVAIIFIVLQLADDGGSEVDSPSSGEPTASGETPSLSIVSVQQDESVSVEASNFPPDTDLDALIALPSAESEDGEVVGSTKTDSSGAASGTFTIPEQFHGESSLIIRLQDGSGYYAFHSFSNQ